MLDINKSGQFRLPKLEQVRWLLQASYDTNVALSSQIFLQGMTYPSIIHVMGSRWRDLCRFQEIRNYWFNSMLKSGKVFLLKKANYHTTEQIGSMESINIPAIRRQNNVLLFCQYHVEVLLKPRY